MISNTVAGCEKTSCWPLNKLTKRAILIEVCGIEKKRCGTFVAGWQNEESLFVFLHMTAFLKFSDGVLYFKVGSYYLWFVKLLSQDFL